MSSGDRWMGQAAVTAFVCVTCRGPADVEARPGRAMFEALAARAGEGVSVVAAECLSVCKRPCTVALSAPGKWTYVIGDLAPEHVEDVITGLAQYRDAADGIIPWRERPVCFRKGVVARIPPLGTR